MSETAAAPHIRNAVILIRLPDGVTVAEFDRAAELAQEITDRTGIATMTVVTPPTWEMHVVPGGVAP